MPLPCRHFRPASITSHFEESIITGTRAMSGSEAIRLRNFTIAACESSMASSMLTSITCAPASTWARATETASANWPLRMRRAKAFEPVTLVRSPTFANSDCSLTLNGSSPDRRREKSVCAGRRGGMPSSARAIAAMCAGVVPQQPPAMLMRPCLAQSAISPASISGVSS
ncbi:MAG: hypothetical protein MOGDAGHF_02565 [Rhodocyclaceae bacterium]|nr:hypothetical protein [Rhodocyclaceae bacterium]